jgi:hypothetical protein
VLDLRLYRLTLLPFAIGMVIVAFSLHAAPGALSGSLPTQGFDGALAAQALGGLTGAGAPGSAGDARLALRLASQGTLEGGFAQTGFTVRRTRVPAQTTTGARSVDVVTATAPGQRPGAVVVIADRANAAATAVLVELAGSLRDVVAQRTLVLVSVSGGAPGIAAALGVLPHDVSAAIVIGGVVGASAGRTVHVAPWSGAGVAPPALRLTVEAALSASVGRHVGDVSLADQLARLALPLTAGGQGPLGDAGIPAVLAGTGGEAANPPGSATQADLSAMGGGLSAAVAALDVAPALPLAPWRGLSIGRQLLDGWALELLGGMLLLSLAACTIEVLARSRRRRTPVLRSLAWALSFAVPFLLAGLFARFLGGAGLLPATPATPVTDAQLPIGASGTAALFSVILLFVLAWGLRGFARRRAAGAGTGPPPPLGASAALLAACCGVAFLIWLENPYAAFLLLLPAHSWLMALTREQGRTAGRGLFVLAVSLTPAIAAAWLLCAGLGVSPFGLVWTVVVLAGSGGLSFVALLLAALGAGCAVAAGMLLLAPGPPPPPEVRVTMRGPLSYAGPGSLGGTSSALRR